MLGRRYSVDGKGASPTTHQGRSHRSKPTKQGPCRAILNAIEAALLRDVGALRARVRDANPAHAGERGNSLRMFRARWPEFRRRTTEYASADAFSPWRVARARRSLTRCAQLAPQRQSYSVDRAFRSVRANSSGKVEFPIVAAADESFTFDVAIG